MGKFEVLDLSILLMKEIGESFSTELTLFVNGSVVSGDMIHPLVYFNSLTSSLRNASLFSPSVGKSLEEKIEKFLNSPGQAVEEPSIVYLKNVEIWSPLNSKKYQNVLLELSLDSIDGVIWGRYQKNGESL